MKSISLIVISFVVIISCKKANEAITLPLSNVATISSVASVFGPWRVANGSWSITGQGEKSYKNFTGLATDQYDFKPDGLLYIQEGNGTDTVEYNIIEGNRIVFKFKNSSTDTMQVIQLDARKIFFYEEKILGDGSKLTLTKNLEK
jgi:hypothetical protein